MRKMILIFIFALMAKGALCATDYSVPLTVLEKYSEGECQNLSSQADLVIEGTFVDVKILEGNAAISAFARAPSSYDTQEEMSHELPFIITFNISKIIKGEYKGEKFNILIHSPGTQFGVNFQKPKDSAGNRYRIYTKKTKVGRVLIGQELLDEK
ncbi:MAG: hypothetical protein Q8N85_01310 [Candidatus Omnitrophota bacterium]|nr:hypothetical protein [Candidatus Omnitrophota bacterium]